MIVQTKIELMSPIKLSGQYSEYQYFLKMNMSVNISNLRSCSQC